jgi:hypothetical protein
MQTLISLAVRLRSLAGAYQYSTERIASSLQQTETISYFEFFVSTHKTTGRYNLGY